MNEKIAIYISALLLLMPSLASANVIFPLTLALLPMLPAIYLSEVAVFLIAVQILKERISPIRIIIAVIIANLVTSGIGLAYPVFEPLAVSLVLSFLISIFVEGLIYFLIFRKILKTRIIFLMSFLANSISYLLIILVHLWNLLV